MSLCKDQVLIETCNGREGLSLQKSEDSSKCLRDSKSFCRILYLPESPVLICCAILQSPITDLPRSTPVKLLQFIALLALQMME